VVAAAARMKMEEVDTPSEEEVEGEQVCQMVEGAVG